MKYNGKQLKSLLKDSGQLTCKADVSFYGKAIGYRIKIPMAVNNSTLLSCSNEESEYIRSRFPAIPLVGLTNDYYYVSIGISNLILVGAENVKSLDVIANDTILVSVTGTGEKELQIPIVDDDDIFFNYNTQFTNLYINVVMNNTGYSIPAEFFFKLHGWFAKEEDFCDIFRDSSDTYSERICAKHNVMYPYGNYIEWAPGTMRCVTNKPNYTIESCQN